MKTLKFLNAGLLVLASLLLVTTIFAFVNGNIIACICNIVWMGCEILYFFVNKKSIEIKQSSNNVYGFLSVMNDTIEEYGSAIITEGKDGEWRIYKGIAVECNEPSCSAENNDQIEFGNNSNVGDKK